MLPVRGMDEPHDWLGGEWAVRRNNARRLPAAPSHAGAFTAADEEKLEAALLREVGLSSGAGDAGEARPISGCELRGRAPPSRVHYFLSAACCLTSCRRGCLVPSTSTHFMEG